MPLTPYSNLVSISNNTGTFPAKLTPGSEVSFRFTYNDVFQGSAGADDFQVTLGASFEVKDQDSNLLLAWSFSITYTVVVFLTLFSYYESRQKVTVTYPIPAPPMLGDPNGIAEPGGGSGYGLGDLSFTEAFESPIFVVNIPAGATVKIVKHTAGYGSLSDIAQLQVRTLLAGGNVSAFHHSRDGEAVIVYPDKGGITQARAVGAGRTLGTPLALKDAQGKPYALDGAVYALRGGGRMRQNLFYSRGGSTYLRVSTNDGLSYGTEMTVYPYFTLLGADEFDRDGIMLLMNDKAGKSYVATIDGTEAYPSPVLCHLPSGVALSSPGQLLCRGKGVVDFFYTDKTGVAHIGSTNDGLTWT